MGKNYLKGNPLLKYQLLLVLTVAMWGAAFPIMKNILNHVDSISFIALRMTIATVVLLLINLKKLGRISRKMIVSGAIYGGILAFSSFFQVEGLKSTSAVNSGFIGTTYVVFMPFFVYFLFGKKPSKKNAAGILTVVLGLLFICGIIKLSPFSFNLTAFNIGDLLTLIFSILTCVYLLYGDKMAGLYDAALITMVHTFFAAIFAWIFTFASPQTQIEIPNPTILLSILYCGVFSCALGYLFTLTAQRHLDPTTTSVFWALEPVFVIFFAAVIPDMNGNVELPTYLSIIGGVLVLLGVWVTSRVPHRALEKESK